MLIRLKPLSLALSSAALLTLAACGGGGDDGDSGSGTYLAITGVKNVTGNPVVTVCLNNVANASANDAKSQEYAANLANFYLINGNYQITSSNYQSCNSLPNPVIVSVDYYNNTIVPWINANPASPGSSNGNGTGGSSPSSGGAVTTTIYVDAGGNWFSTTSKTGSQVFNYKNDSLLNGLTISDAKIFRNGVLIGYADSGHGMYCSNKTGMTITVDSRGWTDSCTQTGSPSNPITNGNNGSPGTNTGGGGSTNPPTASFINWSNSVNGEYVQDASGDFFAFNSQSRCLYSVNTQQEYNNACLNSTGYGYIGTFDSTRVYVMAAKNAVGSGCVAVFADEKNNAVDLYTSNGQEYFRSTDTQWEICR